MWKNESLNGAGKMTMQTLFDFFFNVQSGQPFPEDYIPTIFENYISRIEVGNKTIDMSLWDTAGQVRIGVHMNETRLKPKGGL